MFESGHGNFFLGLNDEEPVKKGCGGGNANSVLKFKSTL
jgi:hypothetical protein